MESLIISNFTFSLDTQAMVHVLKFFFKGQQLVAYFIYSNDKYFPRISNVILVSLLRNKVTFVDLLWDINKGWSRDQIQKILKGFIEHLITYQPVFISRYISKIIPYFLYLYLLQIMAITLLNTTVFVMA